MLVLKSLKTKCWLKSRSKANIDSKFTQNRLLVQNFSNFLILRDINRDKTHDLWKKNLLNHYDWGILSCLKLKRLGELNLFILKSSFMLNCLMKKHDFLNLWNLIFWSWVNFGTVGPQRIFLNVSELWNKTF